MSTINKNLNLHPESAPNENDEVERTRRLAERYRCPFIDLREQRINPELFRSIPAELMFRFNFVPLEAQSNSLAIVVADPSQLLQTDELARPSREEVNHQRRYRFADWRSAEAHRAIATRSRPGHRRVHAPGGHR